VLDHIRKLFGPRKHAASIMTANRQLQTVSTASRSKTLPATPSPLTDTPRIFLSYSRTDAAFAAGVRRLIEDWDLALWQDITDMEAGRWWEQIKDILSAPATEHMVLMVSRDALASRIVRDEWRFARREGVHVSPVAVPGRLGKEDFATMPGWMRRSISSTSVSRSTRNACCVGWKGRASRCVRPIWRPSPRRTSCCARRRASGSRRSC
jgi:hypothetical protein